MREGELFDWRAALMMVGDDGKRCERIEARCQEGRERYSGEAIGAKKNERVHDT